MIVIIIIIKQMNGCEPPIMRHWISLNPLQLVYKCSCFGKLNLFSFYQVYQVVQTR